MGLKCVQKAAADEPSCNSLMETLNCPLNCFAIFFLHFTSCVFKSIINVLYGLCATMTSVWIGSTRITGWSPFCHACNKECTAGHGNKESCTENLRKRIKILEVSALQSSGEEKVWTSFLIFC